MRKCNTCETEKKLSEFRDNRKKCKKCSYSYNGNYHKNYYSNNKEKLKQGQKIYQKENREKLLEYWKDYRENNKEKIAKKQKEYEQSKIGRIKRNLIWNKRRARLISQSDWTLDWNSDFIINMLIKQDNACVLCNCNIANKYDIDHIIPISKWWIHWISNIQLLCPTCNKKKWNKAESFKA